MHFVSFSVFPLPSLWPKADLMVSLFSRNPTTDLEVRTRHSQEAKGLLVQIRHLKLRVTREATFRNDLSYQKTYLGLIVKQKQSRYPQISSVPSLSTSLLTYVFPSNKVSTLPLLHCLNSVFQGLHRLVDRNSVSKVLHEQLWL